MAGADFQLHLGAQIFRRPCPASPLPQMASRLGKRRANSRAGVGFAFFPRNASADTSSENNHDNADFDFLPGCLPNQIAAMSRACQSNIELPNHFRQLLALLDFAIAILRDRVTFVAFMILQESPSHRPTVPLRRNGQNVTPYSRSPLLL